MKVWCGPMFKSIEQVAYRDHHFIKHVPVPDRPALVAGLIKAGLRYFNTDFTSFEKHFTKEVMESIEFVLYEECLKTVLAPDDLKFLFSVLSGENRLSMRLGAKASLFARRMSGEMNTSLGNGFSNLMLALFLAEKAGGHLDGFVEGDDGIFACDFELKKEDYADLGFDIKIIEVANPCYASFCGMVFSDSGQIIKSPTRVLETFGWTHSMIHAGTKKMYELLRAKALSLCYELPQCPIIGALAREALRRSRGYEPRFIADGYHDFERVPRDEKQVPAFSPASDTRILFEKLFHVGVQLQLELEEAIRRDDLITVRRALTFHPDMADYVRRYVEEIPG